MSRPKIAVFAYSEVGAACLEELIADGANVVKVYTHEDDPGETIWFRSVREIAERAGISVSAPKKFGESEIAEFAALGAELVFSFYYRKLIPAAVINSPRLGAYNMHGALLPRYRGRACINWAVLNGESETGATLHAMTDEPDRGGIVAQEAVPVLLETGTAKLTPQDERLATYYGRRRPEDGRIDWSRSAVEIYNLVRAVTRPFPGAFTEMNGRRHYVWRAEPMGGRAAPGRIVRREPLIVGTGDGLLKIIEIEPPLPAEGESFK